MSGAAENGPGGAIPALFRRRPAAWIVAAGSALALVSAAAPLLVYTVSLAAFGLPHVLAELRYVDARFSARIGRRLGGGLLAMLAALVVLRTLGLAGVLPAGARGSGELLVLAGLAALALPALAAAGPGRAVLGAALLALALAGATEAPAATLAVIALLHNLTPLGFLAERLRGAERRRAFVLGTALFGVIPVLLLLGLPDRLLEALGVAAGAAGASFPGAGPLDAHLGAFVPAAWHSEPFAVRLFAAAAFLQVLHYAVVLHVLPRLQRDAAGPGTMLVAWPAGRRFGLAVAAFGGLMLAGFAWSFADARAVYGVFAAVHAWIEIPILLLAAAGGKAGAAAARAPVAGGALEAS